MLKIASFKANDLLFDPSAVADALNKACRRSQPYYLRGVGQLKDVVYFFLLPRHDGAPQEKIVLAPIEDPSSDAIGSELAERWGNGFNTIGVLELPGDLIIGVYGRVETADA